MDPLLFLLLLSFPLDTLSQQQSPMTTNNPPPPPAGLLAPRFNAPIAVLIAVLITAFFFIGFFSVYIRNCSTANRNPSTAPSRAAASRSRRARGLDPSLISSFPTLVYSDVRSLKLDKNALECAVCLSDFEDDDTLRLLPYCNHAFHPDCIDTWLSSHTTCPVCRRNLAAPPQQTDSSADLEAPPVLEQQEHIMLHVDPTSSGGTTVQEDSGSKRFRVRLWRSRTTTEERMHWPEEERERFTLRLPEHVQKDVFAGKLRRSATIAAIPNGERSMKKGFRDEGSSRGGRSFKLIRESVGRSDRWGFLARPLSFKFTKSGSAAGRTIKLGAGEDSSKGKALASPLDSLGSSASVRRDASGDENDQTASHSLRPGH